MDKIQFPMTAPTTSGGSRGSSKRRRRIRRTTATGAGSAATTAVVARTALALLVATGSATSTSAASGPLGPSHPRPHLSATSLSAFVGARRQQRRGNDQESARGTRTTESARRRSSAASAAVVSYPSLRTSRSFVVDELLDGLSPAELTSQRGRLPPSTSASSPADMAREYLDSLSSSSKSPSPSVQHPADPSYKEDAEEIHRLLRECGSPLFGVSSWTTAAAGSASTSSASDSSTSSSASTPAAPLVPPRPATMPPWLAQPAAPPPAPIQIHDALSALRSIMSSKSNLSDSEVHAVCHALETAAAGDPTKLLGAIDFCSLCVETMELGRDALVAAAFHYCSCVSARERKLAASTSTSTTTSSPPSSRPDADDAVRPPQDQVDDAVPSGSDSAYLCALAGSGVERFGNAVVRIALDAARLKGTEAVADAVSSTHHSATNGGRGGGGRLTLSDADNLRSLLLSANAGGDWRALAVRCAACLYRLRGLASHRSGSKAGSDLIDPRHPTVDEIRVAREALHIYAPLANQLGMHRLQTELEGSAFAALYRRQHAAVNALLYRRLEWMSSSTKQSTRGNSKADKGTEGAAASPFFFAEVQKPPRSSGSSGPTSSLADAAEAARQMDRELRQAAHRNEGEERESIGSGMKSVLDDITARVKRMLHEDDVFMEHVSSIKVTARVKQPYSLWRKMLRIHAREMSERAEGDERKPLSVLQVSDAVALRVILTARKLTPNEPDDVTADRERALCYYVHSLCQDNIANGDEKRFKDYIENPKPNGYQSLHYSASMRWHGESWPFEVQIRTADMHRVAEYGIAAHWEYKAKSKGLASGGNGGGNNKVVNPSLDKYLQAYQEHTGNGRPKPTPPPVPDRPGLTDAGDSLLFATVGEEDRNDHDHLLRAERIRERAEHLAPYIEALSETTTDLARERVFVFLSSPARAAATAAAPTSSTSTVARGGTIASLPAGARILDALREEERRSGRDLRLTWGDRRKGEGNVSTVNGVTVLRNGAPVESMTQRLENGDVLTLL